MSVRALYQSQQDVGRNIKSSKKKYTWKFSIDDKDHTIELFVSGLSGKKKVVHNGKTLREEASVLGSFNYSMTIQSNLLTISNNGDLYDLRINNMQFSHLYHNEKTKKEFQFEDGYNEGNNQEDYYSKLPKPSKQNKPLYKEEDQGYDFGLVDDIERMAPKKGLEEQNEFNTHSNYQQKLNIQFKPKEDPYAKFNDPKPQQRQTQSFSNKPQQPQSSFNQQQIKNDFGDFGNFPKPPTTTANDNVFGNFGFGFNDAQQQQAKSQQQPTNQFSQDFKPNPFGDFQQPSQSHQQTQPFQQQAQPFFQQPPQQQVIEQPKPKPLPQANLLDFGDDPIQPPQQQQLPPVQQQSQQQLLYQQQQVQQQQQLQQQSLYKNPVNQPLQQNLQYAQAPQQQQQQQQKVLPQDLLDAFDDPEPVVPQQNQQQQPQFNITSLYQQQANVPIQSSIATSSPPQQQQYRQSMPNQYQPQSFNHMPQQQYQNPQVSITQLYNQPQAQVNMNVPVQINVKTQSTPFDDVF
ncbi:unnamed protein product (macronuclear) [Paramecium tetraurelia]|uniref:FHA domain-containing protein n=1 Tax=Paramecium tetraurelia TaxID=5888 RepID=A0CTW0_PARTE|nr:uncharacterized protein GSPATT00010461001 [Paramecium tetraurelia]CAK74227.1 unnamed protein product [Paramecium tetraurelia]|eukprot:XP_001441624.1 hypothetical protein (macronuclear) [Paramecium tetraurelia strain d4-2]